MIGLIAFFISFLLGYFILKCFKERGCPFNLMDIFLSVGIGLGISAQIVFYTLLILNRIDPIFIIQMHLVCLCGLFLFSHFRRSKHRPPFSFAFQPTLIVILILSIALVLSTIMALARPWGDWDGWSYWNFQSNFLFRSGYEWHRVFEYNIQAHHPWMLPLMIIWGWSFNGREQTIVPMAIGILFTVSTVGLLMGALKKHVSIMWAAIGGLFLTSIPFYIFHGTSQYADIEGAYFILLTLLLALDLLETPSAKMAALTGLCLGLSAGIKDNNSVASVLLMMLIIIRLYKSGGRFIRPLILGFMATGVAVILMKIFDISYGRNHSYDVFWPGMWDGHKWIAMGCYLLHTLTGLMWGGVWLFAVAVLITQQLHGRKQGVHLVGQFIILYILFYFFIFSVSTLKIEWLLSVSFDRLLFLLMPTVIFVMFYAIIQKE